jgi:hypothetical protein
MFCPQCGHQQVSNDTRFCSRCGLPLSLLTGLLDDSGQQLQREKRELKGIGLMIATILLLLNFMIVFGLVALPHLANPILLWLWIFFVAGSLIVGGFGLSNLLRGGFFKRLKERELRLQLMKSERERRALPAEAEGALADAEVTTRLIEPASVTEATTRDLEPNPPKQTAAPSRKREAADEG